MLIELHRLISDGLYQDESGNNRVSIEATDIKQVHEGKGCVTIITTPIGKLAVEESYEKVCKLRDEGCRAF